MQTDAAALSPKVKIDVNVASMSNELLLKWNDHHTQFFVGAEELCENEEYTDVTLVAGNKFFAAHKLVLSICSPYFRQLFRQLGKSDKPVIVLKDVESSHLELVLQYMYKGEIKVQEDELVKVLSTAQALEIKGLSDKNNSEPPAPPPTRVQELVIEPSLVTPHDPKEKPTSNIPEVGSMHSSVDGPSEERNVEPIDTSLDFTEVTDKGGFDHGLQDTVYVDTSEEWGFDDDIMGEFQGVGILSILTEFFSKTSTWYHIQNKNLVSSLLVIKTFKKDTC